MSPQTRAVLVVGAAGTLGAATCRVLADRGATVWAADYQDPAATVSALPGSGHRSSRVDVTDDVAVAALLDEVWRDLPILDGLVYAAGANYTGYVASTSWPDYQRVMDVNVRGAFTVGKALAGRLVDEPRPFGTVWLSSVAGLAGEAGGSVYCASKFALIGFVQSFASEIAASGGRANAVCPGNVDSPMLRQLARQVGERDGIDGGALLDEWARACAFGRLIEPDEVARTCAWLVSPDASGISGQTVVVDGPVAAGGAQ
jgi:NAD(P)-dependent dehydrogenase (short-subunit alcohol dehydrogenase family)